MRNINASLFDSSAIAWVSGLSCLWSHFITSIVSSRPLMYGWMVLEIRYPYARIVELCAYSASRCWVLLEQKWIPWTFHRRAAQTQCSAHINEKNEETRKKTCIRTAPRYVSHKQTRVEKMQYNKILCRFEQRDRNWKKKHISEMLLLIFMRMRLYGRNVRCALSSVHCAQPAQIFFIHFFFSNQYKPEPESKEILDIFCLVYRFNRSSEKFSAFLQR